MPRRGVIAATVLLFTAHGEHTCESGGCNAGIFPDDYSTVLLQADIRMQEALRGDFASSGADAFLVEPEAKEEDICSKEAKLSSPVHPRKFELNDQEKEMCKQLAHEGYWEPPDFMDFERNWCWVYMKEAAINLTEFEGDDMNWGRMPNWWQCQEQASKEGKAPDPRTFSLQPLLHPELCDKNTDDSWHFAAGIDDDGDELDRALHWFNKNVDVYVLNRAQDIGRLENMTARMNLLGIPFIRVEGVGLSEPGEMDAAKDKGLVPRNWSFAEQEAANRKLYKDGDDGFFDELQVGLGTAGCTAAHLNAMMTASESKKPLALILEDDVKLDSRFVLNVKKLLYEEAPCDWEVINLHLSMVVGECVSSHLARVHPEGNEPEEVCGINTNWSFASVLYKVTKLQRVHEELWKVVWNTDRPKCNIHDMAFASISDRFNYYGVPTSQRPGLVVEVNCDSSRLASNLDVR